MQLAVVRVDYISWPQSTSKPLALVPGLIAGCRNSMWFHARCRAINNPPAAGYSQAALEARALILQVPLDYFTKLHLSFANK